MAVPNGSCLGSLANFFGPKPTFFQIHPAPSAPSPRSVRRLAIRDGVRVTFQDRLVDRSGDRPPTASRWKDDLETPLDRGRNPAEGSRKRRTTGELCFSGRCQVVSGSGRILMLFWGSPRSPVGHPCLGSIPETWLRMLNQSRLVYFPSDHFRGVCDDFRAV